MVPSKTRPLKDATTANAEAIASAETGLEELLTDPNSDGAAIAAATGRVDLARAQRARAEQADADATEAARLERIADICRQFEDGTVRQQAIDVLALHADATAAVRALHAAAAAHNRTIIDAHAELRTLGHLPETIGLPRSPGARRLNKNEVSWIAIDGARWRNDPERADQILVDIVFDVCETADVRRRLTHAKRARSQTAIESVAHPLNAGQKDPS